MQHLVVSSYLHLEMPNTLFCVCVCVFSGNLSRIKSWVRRLTVWSPHCLSCLSCEQRSSCSRASSHPNSSAPQSYSDGGLLLLDSNIKTLWAKLIFPASVKKPHLLAVLSCLDFFNVCGLLFFLVRWLTLTMLYCIFPFIIKHCLF